MEVKGKGKQKCDEKSPIDYIAEDFKCPITCETVDGLYQLSCQHSVSPKVFLSLEKQECPYCRTEIKKNSVYYLPQQTVYTNIQHYITEDDQDIDNSTVENNTNTEVFDRHDNLKKQKKKSRGRKYNSGFTLSTIWKTITAPNVNKSLQKAKIAYANGKLEDALNIYSQILQAYPTNCIALYNRALIKFKLGNLQKALLDIETAIEVNNVYDNTWYLGLKTHVRLQDHEKAEQDIGHIGHLFMQAKAFDVINGHVNKLKCFDMEWFKILVDSSLLKAMSKLDNNNQWKSLCNHQYGIDDYTRWYNTAVTWHKTYNNTTYNHTCLNAFYKKVYYMHKSKGLHLIA